MTSAFQSRILTIVLAGVCGSLLLAVAGVHVRRMAAQRDLEQIQDRIAGAERENERLTKEVQRMHEPAWLALLARARLNYKRQDETVVFVYKSEKVDTIVPPQASPDGRPNWEKWVDWVWGR